MKKILLVVLLMAGVAIAYHPIKKQILVDADNYIKEDSIRNRNLAIHQLDSIFNGRKIVAPLYHDFKTHYELLSASQKSNIDKKNKLYQLYEFRPEHFINWDNPIHVLNAEIRIRNSDRGKDWNEPLNGGAIYGIFQSGWAIGCAKQVSNDKYICYLIIPYMVGYLKQNEGFYDYIKPTIEEVLHQAYDFYTTDDRYNLSNFIAEGNLGTFMTLTSRMSSSIIANNYSMKIVANDDNDFKWADEAAYNGTGYWYNRFFRVYISMCYMTSYQLKYHSDLASSDKEMYIEEHEKELDTQIIIAEIILGSILILLVVIYIIQWKKSKETILDRIKKASYPKRYIKKYNQETLEIANKVYNKALNTSMDDKETIFELCNLVETRLGVPLVRKKDITILLNKSNPKHFMKPYNTDKVTKANILYAKLKQGNIKYIEFLQIMSEVDSLYQ